MISRLNMAGLDLAILFLQKANLKLKPQKLLCTTKKAPLPSFFESSYPETSIGQKMAKPLFVFFSNGQKPPTLDHESIFFSRQYAFCNVDLILSVSLLCLPSRRRHRKGYPPVKRSCTLPWMILTFSESLHSFQNSHHHHHKVDQLLCSVWVFPFDMECMSCSMLTCSSSRVQNIKVT